MHINYKRGERPGQYRPDRPHVCAVPAYYRRQVNARRRAKEHAQLAQLQRSASPEDVIFPRLRRNVRYDWW